MTEWRYLTEDSVGAAQGLALDESLAATHRRSGGSTPTTLRLYTYRSHSALCGRFQHLEAEIDVAACSRTGTEFNRRPTGGGAIVMGAGQLGVAIAAPAPTTRRPKEMLLELSAGIVAGLGELGIRATFGGKNDLKVGDRKIAGLGLYLDGAGGLLFHSSILADLDVPFMLQVLDIPVVKLGGAAVAAVERRVTTVSVETGQKWSGIALREVMAKGFARAMGIELTASEPTASEVDRASDLVRLKYNTDHWLFQRSPQADATATSIIKTPGGVVRLYLALSGMTIKSAMFTGDFNELPAGLAEFESRMKWSHLDGSELRTLAEETMGGGTGLGVDSTVIVDMVLEAGRKARAMTAAPDRGGSCYFPETETVSQRSTS